MSFNSQYTKVAYFLRKNSRKNLLFMVKLQCSKKLRYYFYERGKKFMSESRLEKVKKLADMHYRAREKAGRSQEYMALELGVSKKTVQNWEKGISIPDLFQSTEWFRILNTNPLPYYLEFISPYKSNVVTTETDEDNVNETFLALCDEIPTDAKRAILHLFYGHHGSDPFAVLQFLLSYLHLPLKVRIIPAAMVSQLYETEKELDGIICKDDVLPNLNVLNDSIRRARVAVMHKEYGYTVFDSEVAEQVMDTALENIETIDEKINNESI